MSEGGGGGVAQEILVHADGGTSTPLTEQNNHMDSSSSNSGGIPDSQPLFTTEANGTPFDNFTNLGGGDEEPTADSSSSLPPIKGIDPAIYLILAFSFSIILFYFFYRKQQKKKQEREEFFRELDGDKFNIKLPAAVDEYYQIKEKCEDAGWEPGKLNPASTPDAVDGHTRLLAQALMKRCIADIPLVTHLQKESAGMNKLYSQSMCSVKQWKSYQAAEALISAEVEEVRIEADEIEPGWSQLIWKQAMQYHAMLKNRQEMEAKAAAAAREAQILQKDALDTVATTSTGAAPTASSSKKNNSSTTTLPSSHSTNTPNIMSDEELKRKQEEAAEKAAQELIKMEEREKESKKSMTGMKKGFLDSKGGGGSNKKKGNH